MWFDYTVKNVQSWHFAHVVEIDLAIRYEMFGELTLDKPQSKTA